MSREGRPNFEEGSAERERAPRHRYFFHGTLLSRLNNIEKVGFKTKEGRATLAITPGFAHKHKWLDPEHLIAHKQKRTQKIAEQEAPLAHYKHMLETPDEENDQSVILVIEPKQFAGSNIPHTFPREDGDELVFYNHWERNHQALVSEKPWEIKDRKAKEGKEEITVPPEEIKFGIRANPEMGAIFEQMQQEMAGGNFDSVTNETRLKEYLESSSEVVLDRLPDKQDLAREIVNAEMEQYLVTSVRELYLNLKQWQGKEVYTLKSKGKTLPKNIAPENFSAIIESIRHLPLTDETMVRYRQMALTNLETELAKINEN